MKMNHPESLNFWNLSLQNLIYLNTTKNQFRISRLHIPSRQHTPHISHNLSFLLKRQKCLETLSLLAAPTNRVSNFTLQLVMKIQDIDHLPQIQGIDHAEDLLLLHLFVIDIVVVPDHQNEITNILPILITDPLAIHLHEDHLLPDEDHPLPLLALIHRVTPYPPYPTHYFPQKYLHFILLPTNLLHKQIKYSRQTIGYTQKD